MKKNAVIYISIISSALVIGGVGGVVAKRVLGKENIVYIGDSDSLQADSVEILKRFNDYKGNEPTADFATWELINVALEKYRNFDYSYSFAKGTAHTIVEQEVRNFQIKNGDEYFEESLSKSSMVTVANRMYQSGVGGEVSIYKGSIPGQNVEETNFTDNPTKYTSEQYKEMLGRTLDQMFIYAISNKTILTQKSTVLDSQDVELYVELDPIKSTIDYQTQMKNISNLDKRPVFEYVHLTFKTNKDYELISLHVDEKYSAKMGFEVSINNIIDTEYYPNKKYEIPSYNGKLTYSAKGENE